MFYHRVMVKVLKEFLIKREVKPVINH